MVLLLFNQCSSEGENELLICKLFAVLFNGQYRAHFQECAYAYDHGSWNRISSIPYVAIEFATSTLRASEGAFVLMQKMSPAPTRTRGSVARAILQIMSEKTLGGALSSGLDRGSVPPGWASDAAKLSAALIKSFAEPGRDRVIFPNFARWASGDMTAEQRGFNFENMYYDVAADPDEEAKMRRDRRAKSPARN